MSQLSCYTATTPICATLQVADIVHSQQEATQLALYNTDKLKFLALYNTLQPRHAYVQYFSSVICFSSRGLISSFRCGCHGLHVGTGCLNSQKLPREFRVCHVCQSSSVVSTRFS